MPANQEVTKKYISKIMLDGTLRYIKDLEAREMIASILSAGATYLGVTTTALTDRCETAQIEINGETIDMKPEMAGAFVIYRKADAAEATASLEFIWNGSSWDELGSTGTLKSLAFKDSASGNYTPAGTVDLSSESRLEEICVTGTVTGSMNSTYTPTGTVDLDTATNTKGITVTGTVAGSGSASYTPAGTINTPGVSVEVATDGVNEVSVYLDDTDEEELVFGQSQKTFATDVAAELDATVEFTGTSATIESTVTATGDLTGNVDIVEPVSASFSGSAADLTGNVGITVNTNELTGSVTIYETTAAAFSGTPATITVS